MKPIQFVGSNTVFAKDQPEYQPLPAHAGLTLGQNGIVTTCWGLTWRERLKILWSGKIWWQQLTFGQALQPQLPSVEKPSHIPSASVRHE